MFIVAYTSLELPWFVSKGIPTVIFPLLDLLSCKFIPSLSIGLQLFQKGLSFGQQSEVTLKSSNGPS